jgi:hypothetical protein
MSTVGVLASVLSSQMISGHKVAVAEKEAIHTLKLHAATIAYVCIYLFLYVYFQLKLL